MTLQHLKLNLETEDKLCNLWGAQKTAAVEVNINNSLITSLAYSKLHSLDFLNNLYILYSEGYLKLLEKWAFSIAETIKWKSGKNCTLLNPMICTNALCQ